MPKNTLRRFDPVNYLDNESDMRVYLDTVIEGGDVNIIRSAFRHIARARFLIDLSKKTGIDLNELRVALSDSGKPTPETLKKIATAFELKIPDNFEQITSHSPYRYEQDRIHLQNTP